MIFVICGATATGKSDLAVEIAKIFNFEIISADSMQIYREMNIGTNKISDAEKQGVKHYCIDLVNPNESFSVQEYSNIANKIIQNNEKNGINTLICGGTGLYINSLIYEYNFNPNDENIRNEIIEDYNKRGIDYIYNQLLEYNNNYDKYIHKNNVKRVIRTLEIHKITGKKEIIFDNNKIPKKNIVIFYLKPDRSILYDKINNRVDKMFFNDNLPREVDYIIDKYSLNFEKHQSLKAIGYKEFENFYNNSKSLELIKNDIKLDTRHYAKRQETWFNSYNNAIVLKSLDFNENTKIITDNIKNILKI